MLFQFFGLFSRNFAMLEPSSSTHSPHFHFVEKSLQSASASLRKVLNVLFWLSTTDVVYSGNYHQHYVVKFLDFVTQNLQMCNALLLDCLL
jgi:hypothetical protein